VKKIFNVIQCARVHFSPLYVLHIVDTHFHQMAQIFLSQILSGAFRSIRRCDLTPYFFCFFSDFGPSCGLGLYFLLFTPLYFLYVYFVLFLYAFDSIILFFYVIIDFVILISYISLYAFELSHWNFSLYYRLCCSNLLYLNVYMFDLYGLAF
jgi:hypothetical protein